MTAVGGDGGEGGEVDSREAWTCSSSLMGGSLSVGARAVSDWSGAVADDGCLPSRRGEPDQPRGHYRDQSQGKSHESLGT